MIKKIIMTPQLKFIELQIMSHFLNLHKYLNFYAPVMRKQHWAMKYHDYYVTYII
jgi:hypothetical protein